MSDEHPEKLVGLIGYPVEHSLSPVMHNAAFAHIGLNWRYVLLPVPAQHLSEQIGKCLQQGYAGWNITVPHKQLMLAYLDKMSEEVRVTGACNTVRVHDSRLMGFNTDSSGFTTGLAEAGGINSGSQVVLMGAGGAARAVAWALATSGHGVLVLSRNPEQSASLSRDLALSAYLSIRHGCLSPAVLNDALPNASLLVNCTPAGMWPHTDTTPLPEGTDLPSHLLVYDLVYRPRPTRLTSAAKAVGCRVQDGLSMLVHQGADAFELWTGYHAPRHIMRAACLSAGSAEVLP